jgi:hypothetical protein
MSRCWCSAGGVCGTGTRIWRRWVAGSCGDVPLIELRWRCSNCRSRAPAAGEAARVRWPAVISILKGKTDVTLRSATRCIAGGAA